ncbi:hypothetical protein SAMN03097699_2453 [Flavobacteriaceae bacterium MAR_2010_188]|nr:hypothetical protein SAMN03097699_2453 [Flavobacteriaceae bacterium MAR_2010_188]
MKTLKLLLGILFISTSLVSCQRDPVYVEPVVPTISLNQLLSSHEIWYVDINKTVGFGETPFMQFAFTLSFRNSVLYANNNLVGLGDQGGGYGIPIGTYDAYDMILDVDHDIDGFDSFDVYQIDDDTIELYNPFDDTSYFLEGYDRSNFDYEYVFYDNIHYFLQEYEAWEKTFTSEMGVLNEFDNENYLQFLAADDDSVFRSSQDYGITNTDNIIWDYTGVYGVGDITDDFYLKTLFLDYDSFDDENFELTVLNDANIELYHITSGTVYEFTGRGYIQILRQKEDGSPSTNKKDLKKRKQKTPKKANPRESTRA